jgi:aminoglycoside 6-adenylyltransferase
MSRSQQFMQVFLEWVRMQDDISGVLLIGSQARRDRTADEWSDFDLILLCRAPERFLVDGAWLDSIGQVLLTTTEDTAVGKLRERRVLFADGQDVDIIPIAAERFAQLLKEGESDLRKVLARGALVLMDRNGLLADVARMVPPPEPTLDAADFDEIVQDFWYHAVWAAKKLRRGEVWVAESCCDSYMKKLLLRLMEWQATLSGGAVDVWHHGRFLECWADPMAQSRLGATFSTYAPESVRDALVHTMDLFTLVAEDIAIRKGFKQHDARDAQARAMAEQILRGV